MLALLPIHSRKTLWQDPHKGTSVQYLKLNRVNVDYVLEQETARSDISLSLLQRMGSSPKVLQSIKPLYILRQLPFLFREWKDLCVFGFYFNLPKCGGKLL